MYKIIITKDCLSMLQEITDVNIKEKIKETINSLKENPEIKGKSLVDDLIGYRSIRSVGQRYRIIYSINDDKVSVYIVAAGIRREGDKKDIYYLAAKMKKNFDKV